MNSIRSPNEAGLRENRDVNTDLLVWITTRGIRYDRTQKHSRRTEKAHKILPS